jgi:predicted GNAT family N-acyltransferase
MLGAQVHALGFYERLGFAAVGPVYRDAGIEHRDMVLEL